MRVYTQAPSNIDAVALRWDLTPRRLRNRLKKLGVLNKHSIPLKEHLDAGYFALPKGYENRVYGRLRHMPLHFTEPGLAWLEATYSLRPEEKEPSLTFRCPVCGARPPVEDLQKSGLCSGCDDAREAQAVLRNAARAVLRASR